MKRPRVARRAFLRSGAVLGASGLAGCFGFSQSTPSGPVNLESFRGSGPLVEQRPTPGGTPIAELPDLSGTLTVYLGGGEGGLYLDLIELLERQYPEFTVKHRTASSSQLANTLIEELGGSGSPADVFWAVDAGALGVVAEEGGTEPLPDSILEIVPATFRTDAWVSVSGRARSIPYYTDRIDADDVPNDVMAFPDRSQFADAIGWAPTYGAFQSFVTAMRLLEGDDRTIEWLRGMVDLGVTEYPDEFLVSNAVADGEIAAGFANHYYAIRVQSARPKAPIDLAFTSNDAGALVNVSGAEIIRGTDKDDLARTFIRHLLSAEAQEFFATRTFAYPMIPEVEPVGGLPTIDELDPPAIDLTELADIRGTLELMREAEVL